MEGGKRVACGGVPEARRVVVRGRRHLLAIGTKGSGAHGSLMAGEGGKRVACGGVPEARRVVGRGRHHLLAIGTKGSGAHETLVAGEGGKRVACGGVPEARRVVGRGRHHLLAIGTKGSGPDGTFVASISAQLRRPMGRSGQFCLCFWNVFHQPCAPCRQYGEFPGPGQRPSSLAFFASEANIKKVCRWTFFVWIPIHAPVTMRIVAIAAKRYFVRRCA